MFKLTKTVKTSGTEPTKAGGIIQFNTILVLKDI